MKHQKLYWNFTSKNNITDYFVEHCNGFNYQDQPYRLMLLPHKEVNGFDNFCNKLKQTQFFKTLKKVGDMLLWNKKKTAYC